MNEPEPVTTHPLPPGLIHDLRTPLSQIIGYSEMLLEEAQEQGRDDFVPDLRKTHAAGQHLLALIDDHFHPTHESAPPAADEMTNEEVAELPPSAFRLPPFNLASGAAQGVVLVVDDIEANRDVLSRRLKRQGYTVATAGNGRQALESLRAATFDLVLLDIMMPEMDGYEVLRRLKADEALRYIPVIVISALSELESVVRCIEMGAEDYLPKPFDPTLLKARIGACLEKKRARDRETQLFAQLQENHRRLQELEKLRDDLMHMIIHDLRTPLNGMLLSVQAVEVMGGLDPTQREMIGITRSSGETLMGMINELLDISKMESGTMQLERQEVTAANLIGSAVQQVAPLANARNLTLATELEPGVPGLMADEAKLLRTLVNLLSNAVKFTPSGGTVTVAMRPANDGLSLLFSVSDTGEGIPSEALVRIFEKFGQVESRHAGRTMSTGLGLTFCKLVVEAHGGHIGVESAPGQGSTFCFTIPLPAAIAGSAGNLCPATGR